jgi:3-dehydroquinate synthase
VNASAAKARDVPVRLGKRSYDVRVAPGALADAGALIAGRVADPSSTGPTVVVTNAAVRALYGRALTDSLSRAGASSIVTVEIGDGERFKTVTTVEKIYDAALDGGVDRTSLVVALGGGVVGDVAGYAAATLLRGLRLVMLPTTLLAQVDSSIGGKTGVNRPQGKNLVGMFHQASLVIADPATLATLSEREYKAGLAEVVKYGVILDEKLFDLLERRSTAVVSRDPALMTDVVARSVELKADVVEKDETESSLRRILNFGHTIGHALEQATSYERYLHGEAVAIGMVAAARLSAKLGACDSAVVTRIARLLGALGLATEMPKDIAPETLARAVALDKKAARSGVAFIVCTGIGSCREQRLTAAEIVSALAP